MSQADLKKLSRPQKIQEIGNPKESIAVDVYDIELDKDTCTMLNQSPTLAEAGPRNDPERQSPQELREMIGLDSDKDLANQAEELLESPSNNDAPDYQGGVDDDDPFSWEV